MKISGIALLLLLSVSWAKGWGVTGHRAVGLIATNHLNSKASKKLKAILEGESLSIASTWMDEVRSERKYNFMSDWHWVTIPDGMTYEQTEKNSNGDIIATINRIVSELKSRKLTRAEEVEHIRILIHLVGDIHQPLHVGTGEDKGGNEVKVKWFGKATNLHGVWDSDMIDETKLSFTELAESVDHLKKDKVNKLQRSSVLDWANESMQLRKQVYNVGDKNLGYKYSYENMDTVRKRILEAGIRLAGLLNEIYG